MISPTKPEIGRLKQLSTIIGGMLGLAFSVSTVFGYTIGVFITIFSQEFSWTRGDVAICSTMYTLGLFVTGPIGGRLADQFPAARIALLSMLAFGVILASFPLMVSSPQSLWAAYLLAALAGLGTSPSVLLKPVIASFSEKRGLAIGITLCGLGFGGFAMLQLASALVEWGGWEWAYRGMGIAVILVAPLVFLALSQAPEPATGPSSEADAPGMDLGEAARTRTFALLLLVSFLGGFGVSGVTAHSVPHLRDLGFDAASAAGIAGLIGLASIAGRLTTGFCLDKVKGPAIGLLIFTAGAAGSALLASGVSACVTPGIILVGFAIGAEIDMFAYFVSRYFGLKAAGAIFGFCYGMVALGSGISPYLVGAMRERDGDYALGFSLLAATMIAAAIISPFLGRFRFSTH